MRENILFICGSLNQTTQMHQIAQQLAEGHQCYFTPYFADGLEDLAASKGWLDFTVLGGRHRKNTLAYLHKHCLPLDARARGREYDLIVTCSDLLVQKDIRGRRLVLVQEGITEPEGIVYQAVRRLKFLPRYLANTASAGLSDAYDIFCVASEGYREQFMRKGVRAGKIAVTGIPNFDDLTENLQNDFPYHDYVLVATTPYRESLRLEDRRAFLRQCASLSRGRPVIFKLHPTEHARRARREIRSVFPKALIFTEGNVNHMIANAAIVITQQSSCTFVAVGLGKETHSYLDLQTLRRLMPLQNNGASAARIAAICRRLLQVPMPMLEQVRKGIRASPRWELAGSGSAFTER